MAKSDYGSGLGSIWGFGCVVVASSGGLIQVKLVVVRGSWASDAGAAALDGGLRIWLSSEQRGSGVGRVVAGDPSEAVVFDGSLSLIWIWSSGSLWLIPIEGYGGLGPFGEVCGRCQAKALSLGAGGDDACECDVPLRGAALDSLPTLLASTQGENPRPSRADAAAAA